MDMMIECGLSTSSPTYYSLFNATKSIVLKFSQSEIGIKIEIAADKKKI